MCFRAQNLKMNFLHFLLESFNCYKNCLKNNFSSANHNYTPNEYPLNLWSLKETEFNFLLKEQFFSKSYRPERECLKIHKSFRLQTRNTSVKFRRRDLFPEYPEIQILYDLLCWVWIQRTWQGILLTNILRPELINFINRSIKCLMKDNLKWEHHCLIHFDHHQNGQREV